MAARCLLAPINSEGNPKSASCVEGNLDKKTRWDSGIFLRLLEDADGK